MVAIAQVVEHLVVVEGVAGSSPVSHPQSALPPDSSVMTGASPFVRRPADAWVAWSHTPGQDIVERMPPHGAQEDIE